jgi:hypothetical protein
MVMRSERLSRKPDRHNEDRCENNLSYNWKCEAGNGPYEYDGLKSMKKNTFVVHKDKDRPQNLSASPTKSGARTESCSL